MTYNNLIYKLLIPIGIFTQLIIINHTSHKTIQLSATSLLGSTLEIINTYYIYIYIY